MKVVITLLDDDGLVLAEHESDAAHPTQWRPAPGQQLIAGHYEINGFTYQPHVRSLSPNGYQDEMKPLVQPPFPLSGQPQRFSAPASTCPASRPFSFPQGPERLASASQSDKFAPSTPGDPQSQR